MGLLNRYRKWRLRRSIKIAIRVLRAVDRAMMRLGWDRARRKQVWRGFIKEPANRESLIDILKEVK